MIASTAPAGKGPAGKGSHRQSQVDPLAPLRAPDDPPWDVYLTGTVFLDIIFTGLDSAPVRGTESWARGMGSSPGGVANMATALARLGLRTSLAAAFGDDHYGDYCWDALEHGEGGDVGWDDTGAWDLAALPDLRHCEAFLPNAEEAMRYTGADCPRAAAHALTDYVPLAVVTLGADGAYAVDRRTGETAEVPAIEVEALDPTGAGDVFVAGFVTGTLADWPLADRLAFAGLTAALSVQEFGGSLSAPGWSEIAAWWRRVQSVAGQDPEALQRYGFLAGLVSEELVRPWPLRRAVPTIGFRRSA
ncbi:carbohydrate kinase family protein [Streptomyces sp. URMC 128]|uniref:carbohydrate kinase family protein n=1 Tax=Streptomyces sp. URMC 128 TaxID=3423404 RepID=UPI003F1D601B